MRSRLLGLISKRASRWTFGCVSSAGIAFFGISAMAKEESVALNAEKFKPFKLLEVYDVSHNTRKYRFELEDPNQKLGLNVASCLVVSAPIGENGKAVVRPYTPVSDPEDRGFFDLVIKTYPQGVMSKHVASLKPGDTLEFKGPFAKIPITTNMKKKVAMIAGGTGITPMFQVINEILKNPQDKTEIILLYANLSEKDILLKDQLDQLSFRHRDRFHVHYTIDKSVLPNWKHDVGFISSSMVKKYLPPPSNDTVVMVCGPPGLMNLVSGDKAPDYSQGELTGLLKDLGYSKDGVFKF